MGNVPIFICTPAIQRCQPGPASSNTCKAASPDPVTCGGTTPICCKEITGLGALPFTCVDDTANCPSVTSSTSSTTTACVTDDDQCDTSSGSPPCCVSSKFSHFWYIPNHNLLVCLFTYNTSMYLILPILLASTCVNDRGTKTCVACIATGSGCTSSGPPCCNASEFSLLFASLPHEALQLIH